MVPITDPKTIFSSGFILLSLFMTFTYWRLSRSSNPYQRNNLLLTLFFSSIFFYYTISCIMILFSEYLPRFSTLLQVVGFCVLALLIVATIFPLLVYFFSTDALIKQLGAQKYGGREVELIVNDVSRRFGRTPPEIHVIESQIPNALTLGKKGAPHLIITSSLLGLHPSEIRAVCAHEFIHIAKNDSLIKTFTSTVSNLLFFDPVTKWVDKMLFFEREFIADLESARITEDPLSLSSALRKIFNRMPESSFGLPLNSTKMSIKEGSLTVYNGLPTQPSIKNRLIVNKDAADASRIDERVRRLEGLEEELRH
jgi:Zn-dependent protease with chaperone function